MNPFLWFQQLSRDQLESILFGAFVLICAMIIAFMREPPYDELADQCMHVSFWERCQDAIREFLFHLSHLLGIVILFAATWAYFSCFNDLWGSFCGLFGISKLNFALIPALTIVCVAFVRLVTLIHSIFESEDED